MSFKIVSYNINGIRSAIKKGLIEWIEANDFDIICLQEVKAHSGSVPLLLFESLGYKHYWHAAQRKGYSGVATLTKQEPKRVFQGMGFEKYDAEGRVLRTDFDEWTLLNCYFPNGKSGPERHQFKQQFLEDFYYWIEGLREHHPNLVVVGDYNIAHQKIDINDPVRNKNQSGFLPEERQWMTDWFASGFVDAFRHLHCDDPGYTWWRTTQFARRSDKGWRLDYQSISDPLQDRLLTAKRMVSAAHSDHCPVLVEMDFQVS